MTSRQPLKRSSNHCGHQRPCFRLAVSQISFTQKSTEETRQHKKNSESDFIAFTAALRVPLLVRRIGYDYRRALSTFNYWSSWRGSRCVECFACSIVNTLQWTIRLCLSHCLCGSLLWMIAVTLPAADFAGMYNVHCIARVWLANPFKLGLRVPRCIHDIHPLLFQWGGIRAKSLRLNS